MGADRRTVILRGAARVIARRGVRGLRVTELAAEAGVSTALVYYHFKDRAGILRQTLEFISNRAERYTAGRAQDAGDAGAEHLARDPLRALEHALLLEFQDLPEVRENSTAWGELRATAVFDPDLRDPLTEARSIWIGELTDALRRVHPAAPAPALALAAERLVATLEGLSMRWLSEVLPLAHARRLMREAMTVELARLESAAEAASDSGRAAEAGRTADVGHAPPLFD